MLLVRLHGLPEVCVIALSGTVVAEELGWQRSWGGRGAGVAEGSCIKLVYSNM